MKKTYTKYIVGACLVISGIILAIIGVLMGGFDVIRNGISFSWNEGFSYDTEERLIEISPEENNIENLYVNVSCTDFTLSYADVDRVIVEADGVRKNQLRAQVNESTNTLEISYIVNGFTLFSFAPSGADIKVTLPRGTKFNKVDFNLGVGDAHINELEAAQLDVNSDVGDTTIIKGSADIVTVDSGVGDIVFRNFYSKGFGADTGVGSLSYDGIIDGNVSLSTGVGEVNMNLSGQASDYSYAVNKGLGAVTLNGASLWTTENAHSTRLFTISSGVGAVSINIR